MTFLKLNKKLSTKIFVGIVILFICFIIYIIYNKKFETFEALKSQLEIDKKNTLHYFKNENS